MNGIITDMGIQYEVLPDYIEGAEEALDNAVYNAQKRKTPFFLLVKRQCFLTYKYKSKFTNDFPMTREDALKII